ncbi:hypothetical protein [Shewanella sp. NIFS-20-20]|uniref:hypothetical protein n=1 Tax=Shewanella sp. NIFS-20-20 TaxID=2853806 RepID=UPI001C487227|nr:hypothetical protein [Shewanella sp. NIFS-20-20]MBV7315716.1 hypothetical protein [Shewanella sp. NIFS-20-20]
MSRFASGMFGLIMSCCWSSMASAANDPLSVLQTCQELLQPQPSFVLNNQPEIAAKQIDELLSPLSRLYFDLFHLSELPSGVGFKQALTRCQIVLGDRLQTILLSAPIQAWLPHGLLSSDADVRQFAQRIDILNQQRLAPQQKGFLSTLEASIHYHLANSDFSLRLDNPQCLALDIRGDNVTGQLAEYLLREPSSQCRQSSWTAYQQRAQSRNSQALNALAALRQTQANEQGLANYNNLQLLNTPMASEEQRRDFIKQASHHPSAMAPWSLYQTLTKQQKSAQSAMSTAIILEAWRHKLTSLGYQIVGPPHHWQMSYQDRALGSVMFNGKDQSKTLLHIQSLAARPAQIAQVVLDYPININSWQQVNEVLAVFAQAIVTVSASSQFSLNNHNELTGEHDFLAKYWLIKVLTPAYHPWFRIGEREQTLKHYRENWQLFQAAAIIDFYGDELDLPTHFNQLFGAPWPLADNAFYGISELTSGASVMTRLWAQAMANYLYQLTPACRELADKQMTHLLLVNPSHHSLQERLTPLLAPHSLRTLPIGSFYYDNDVPPQALTRESHLMCTKLRQLRP